MGKEREGTLKGRGLAVASEKERREIKFKPCVIIFSGLPLTGKTTLAEKLVNTEEGIITNFSILDVDNFRPDIDPTRKRIDPSTDIAYFLPPSLLSDEQEFAIMDLVYGKVCFEAARLALEGRPVIIAGAFSRPEIKKPLVDLKKILEQARIPLRVFELHASLDELEKRIETRRNLGSASNIDSREKLDWQMGFFKSIDFIEVVNVNTEDPEYISQVLSLLNDLREEDN